MADNNARELMRLSEKMFSKKWQLDSLWQRLAEEFYPERADFTVTRLDGEEFAEELYESLPAQNRRELAYAMGSLMRPSAKPWFKQVPQDERSKTDRSIRWLEHATVRTRKMIYAGQSGFSRNMQDGDNDVITFGNAVHSILQMPDRSAGILFETHHLRDCAWSEDRYRRVNRLDRKMKVALSNWSAHFPQVELSTSRKLLREKQPDHEVDIRHVVVPIEQYEFYRKIPKQNASRRRPRFASVYIDAEEAKVVREGFYYHFPYRVRRWNLRPGSPYGYSPAAMLGLIDARVLQAQSRVILDAGELAVRPPLLARDEVLGDAAMHAGSIMWFSPDYEGRASDVLSPVKLGQDMGVGLEMKVDTRAILAAAFFLNKLMLPSDKDMTAYEASERIAEYIRSIGPVIEPFEADNTGVLDDVFDLGMTIGAYGPIEEVPPELRGADLGYEFNTPIQIAYERQKVMRAREAFGYMAESVQATQDPSLFDHVDKDRVFRDGLQAIDGGVDWLLPPEQVMAKRERDAQAAQQQQQLEQTMGTAQALGAAADTVPKLAAANQAIPQIIDMRGAQQEQAVDEDDWPEEEDPSVLMEEEAA